MGAPLIHSYMTQLNRAVLAMALMEWTWRLTGYVLYVVDNASGCGWHLHFHVCLHPALPGVTVEYGIIQHRLSIGRGLVEAIIA
eukprot:scaffold790_cov387-Prasinococcus_capsulatus_cf.AAC.4